DLDDVEAERSLDDVADLTDIEGEGRRIELRDHLAAAEEAQVAALLGAARVLAELLGELGEVGATCGTCTEVASLIRDAVPLGRRGVRRDTQEDVAGTDLCAGLLLLVKG